MKTFSGWYEIKKLFTVNLNLMNKILQWFSKSTKSWNILNVKLFCRVWCGTTCSYSFWLKNLIKYSQKSCVVRNSHSQSTLSGQFNFNHWRSQSFLRNAVHTHIKKDTQFAVLHTISLNTHTSQTRKKYSSFYCLLLLLCKINLYFLFYSFHLCVSLPPHQT